MMPLLGDKDPPPVEISNPAGSARFLLIADHAGNVVPERLAGLGVDEAELHRHIGWDIGIAGLGEQLSGLIDASFIRQTYSRLVIDCNRDPEAADAIPEVSDGTRIPANVGLALEQRQRRIAEIHSPYQQAIADALARRDRPGEPAVLVALHSFTPRFAGEDRPWQIGVLHHKGEPAFALRVLKALRAMDGLVVGDNQPYQMDGIDYTVPRHAYSTGRPYVELEIRQDLIDDAPGQSHWAAIVEAALAAVRAG